MKICITSMGLEPVSGVDPRFGRAEVFAFIETESGEVVFKPNNAVSASGGAGVKAAQFVVAEKAQAVLTGDVGPNAFKVLETAGVAIYTSVEGSVEEAIKSFQEGKLNDQQASSPTVKGK